MAIRFHFGVALITSLLLGCGGASSDTTSSNDTTLPESGSPVVQTPSSSITFNSLDNINAALLGEPTVVELDTTLDGTLLALADEPIITYGDCYIDDFSTNSFTFQSNSVGECGVEYQLIPASSSRAMRSDENQTGTARFTVSTRADNDTILTPRSLALFSENGAITVDIQTLLGSDWPSSTTGSFVLDTVNAIEVLGASVTATQVGDTSIEITPVATQGGITRITYSLTDQSVTKSGSIDVSVSVGDGENHRPVAKDYVYETAAGAGYLKQGQAFTITLTDAYISDPDNTATDPNHDTLTIVDVSGYNMALPSVSESSPITNGQITITPYKSGRNHISYTVSDGNGGFDIGMVEFMVELDASVVNQSWENITITDTSVNSSPITFTAPMVKILADELSLPYTLTYTEQAADNKGPANSELITTNYVTAKNYCTLLNGRLPTPQEMEALKNNVGSNLYTAVHNGKTVNWPTSVPFWTSYKSFDANVTDHAVNAGDMAEVWDMNTATANSGYTVEGDRYVTCVLFDDLSISNFTIEMSPQSDQSEAGRLRMKAVIRDPHGNLAPYKDIELSTKYGTLSATNNTTVSVEKVFTANFRGEFYFDFRELNDQTDETITAKIGNRVIGTYAYTAGNSAFESVMRNLDIHYSGMLSQNGSNGNAETVYYDGLKLWANKSGARYVNTYKEDFIGKNFSVYLALRAMNENTGNANFNFTIQQHTNPFTSTPDTGTNDFPGIAGVKSLNVSFIKGSGNNSLTYKISNGRNSIIAAPSTNNSGQIAAQTHFWIDYDDATKTLKIYTSKVDSKPATPRVTETNVTMGTVDPSQPYWIQIGSYTSQSNSTPTYLSTVKFNSWD